MSAGAARLFDRLQNARFYRQFHADAMQLVGDRTPGRWLDVGCGPGLWACLAAARGYDALGVDRDADMVSAARRRALRDRVTAQFATADIETMIASGERFDIVSASSLLVVTTDPRATLSQLFELVAPGGSVLVLEASPRMSRIGALKSFLSGRLGPGGSMLLNWALARSGSALDNAVFEDPRWVCEQAPMLGGMVNAWCLREPGS